MLPDAQSATGEVLTAERVDSVSTFESKTTVAPAQFHTTANNGRLILQLAP